MHRLFSFVIILSGFLHAQETKTPVFCQSLADGGKQLEQKFGRYTLTLSPSKDQDDPCMATLLRTGQTRLWERKLWQAEFASSPIDISNDGNPDFIIEDYSGGAHCCWAYWIVSPGLKPAVVAVLSNQMPITFDTRWRGKQIISTEDGAFDYFVTSHAFSSMPDVYFLLQDRELYDISGEPEFRAQYDQNIARAKQELAKRDPAKKWLSQPINEIDEEIRFNIVTIVLSYLYSRRPAEAWRSLNELWPEYDRLQMKANILKTRRNGILKRALPFPQK
jgi:hypothetical protein